MGGTNKTLCTAGNRRKEKCPHTRLTQTSWECPGVSGGGGSTGVCCRVRGTECGSACMEPFEGGHHYLHYLHHSLPSGQKTGREQVMPMNRARAAAMAHRAQPRGVTPRPRSGAAAKSARLQRCRNGREELPHVQGQGRRPGGATPCPRNSGCAGAGGPRGAIPPARSEGPAVRRYPSSKVRSSGCTLLEQP